MLGRVVLSNDTVSEGVAGYSPFKERGTLPLGKVIELVTIVFGLAKRVKQTETRIDGRMVQIFVFAEVYFAYIGCGLSQTATYGYAQRNGKNYERNRTYNAFPDAGQRMQHNRRDTSHAHKQYNGIHSRHHHTQRYVTRRNTGHGICR